MFFLFTSIKKLSGEQVSSNEASSKALMGIQEGKGESCMGNLNSCLS